MVNLLIKLGYTPKDFFEMSMKEEKVSQFIAEAALFASLDLQRRKNANS